ncbi:hypothetical protein FRY98_24545 [Paenibacillus faecis]|uniref:Peptidase C39-like domain-containing protein n=1 Tax=Paenibacillus faecis TaxID=862114 RepID=A0A5D0CMN2_9BACL|nr:C39 family peptidase [Paenibacillus faecis]TYA10942.1 hypothetical protein FRY98_24545 [Paenibacillus faecis]
MKLVYYSQEDPRWRNVMYSITGDKKQTIGTSACGPTCASMVASSYTGKTILPTEAASFAVKKGFRTANSGTDWGFFKKFFEQYGLECKQTGSLADVKAALKAGELAIASMGPGHTTGGGHYIHLVGISKEGWIDVYDPNHDNRKYGNDGLIEQGVRDDGKIKVKEIVFAREAKQYWIISKPKQEDDEVKREEFEALEKRIEAIEKHINISGNQEPPAWAVEAIGAAKAAGAIKTSADKSLSEIKMIQMLFNMGFFNKEAK